MILKIDNVDIMPYVLQGGLQWTRNDVSGGNKTTMQDGSTLRDRIASKFTYSVPCRLLNSSELGMLLSLIRPEYVTVEYSDPETETTNTGSFFVDSAKSTYLVTRADGSEWWGGLTFTLQQR